MVGAALTSGAAGDGTAVAGLEGGGNSFTGSLATPPAAAAAGDVDVSAVSTTTGLGCSRSPSSWSSPPSSLSL